MGLALSKALAAIGPASLTIKVKGGRAVPVEQPDDVEVNETLYRFGHVLSYWWSTSPSAIIECSQCGDVRFTGSKSSAGKKCGSCREGKYEALDPGPYFTKKRPRGKKVKLGEATRGDV